MLSLTKTGMIATQASARRDRCYGGIALLYLVEMVLVCFFHFRFPAINAVAPWESAQLFVSCRSTESGSDFDMIETGVQTERRSTWNVWRVRLMVRSSGLLEILACSARRAADKRNKLPPDNPSSKTGPTNRCRALVTRRSCICTAPKVKASPMSALARVAAIVIQHGGGEDEVMRALCMMPSKTRGPPRLDEIRENSGPRRAHRMVHDSSNSPAKNGMGREKRATSRRSHEPMTSGSFRPKNWQRPRNPIAIAPKAMPFSTLHRPQQGTLCTTHARQFIPQQATHHRRTRPRCDGLEHLASRAQHAAPYSKRSASFAESSAFSQAVRK